MAKFLLRFFARRGDGSKGKGDQNAGNQKQEPHLSAKKAAEVSSGTLVPSPRVTKKQEKANPTKNSPVKNRPAATPDQAQKGMSVIPPPPENNLREKEQARHERTHQRRQIRRALQELLDLGERCSEGAVVDFIDQHREQMDLIREMFVEFRMFHDRYPLTLIQQYLAGESLEHFKKQLETRNLLAHLDRQRRMVAEHLPDPLRLQVAGSPQGPQFAALTAEAVQQEIKRMQGTTIAPFEVIGPFPCHHPGDYSLQLDFSHEVMLPLILRLEARPDPLPEDCQQDFGEEISPLSLDFSQDILILLQKQLESISPTEEIAYYSQLSVVLVTAYQYGYGLHPWVQTLLQEWRNKRLDYALVIGFARIKDAIERLNRESAWHVSLEQMDGEATSERLLSFAHRLLEQDPVLSHFELRLQMESSQNDALPAVALSWKGMPAGAIQFYPQTSLSSFSQPEAKDAPLHVETKTGIPSLEDLLARMFSSGMSLNIQTLALELQSAQKQIKRRVLEANGAGLQFPNAPTSPTPLHTQIRKYNDNQERAEQCLRLACSYAAQGNETLFRLTLAQYCLAYGWKLYYESRREARPYFQSFFLLNNQLPQETLSLLRYDLYRCAALYFGTYNFTVDVRNNAADIAERFSVSLRLMLSTINRNSYESLGRCILELTLVSPSLMLDQCNRWKTRQENQVLQNVAAALQGPTVFRQDPLTCLQLLQRIDPQALGLTLSRQTFANVNERRRIVIALVKFAHSTNAPAPAALLNGFAMQVNNDTRIVLAFSLLVEPFVLSVPSDEDELKATLIAEALGLPTGIVATEHFLGKAIELATLFDRFLKSYDPNVKGRYAITILDTIRSLRRPLIEHLREGLSERNVRESLVDILLQFLHRVEAYVTAEQAKLIHDTTLELVLISDRALHSFQQTRLAVEIRNVGEGIADHLRLEVFPVTGKYTVEERYRMYTIDHLTDKTPIQLELFIRPVVEINNNLELSLKLCYDTLKNKGKEATLKMNNQTVWLYPENQFVRVPQPYNPGVPATTWFYGRKDLLEVMADCLRTGRDHDTSMIVYGIKRAGKTSVVRRFVEHTLETRGLSETHIPIYTDMLLRPQSIRTDSDLLYYLLEIIHRTLTEERKFTLPFIPAAIRLEFQQDHLNAFTIHLNEVLTVLGDQRLLLVLDEFSTLNEGVSHAAALEPSLSRHLFSFLSNTIQSYPQLTFIFTGTYMLLDMMRTHMYDLFKICKPFLISFLEENSARLLITDPVRKHETNPERGWLEYDERVVDRMIYLTHCHPYLIQNICGLLVDRMNSLKYHRVNLNDLEAIIENIITNPTHEMVLLNLWREFSKTENSVLSVIAGLTNSHQDAVEIEDITTGFRELGESLPVENISTICNSLKDAELLERIHSPTEQSETYRITIPLYQRWIKQNWPLHAVFGKRSVHSPR
jgi:hypothetical protein